MQDTPACVTLTLCPPMVSVALRALAALFAATVTVTVPLPLPLAGDTVAHAAFDEAVHAHPASAVTVTDEVPPAAAGDNDVGLTV